MPPIYFLINDYDYTMPMLKESLSPCSRPDVIPNVYDFLLSVESECGTQKNIFYITVFDHGMKVIRF